MPFIKNVNRYIGFQYPNGKGEARINLYCEEGYRLYVLFRDSSDSLPPNTYNDSIKTGVAYDTRDQYSAYIDLLRNENPMRVTFNPDVSPPQYVVYTGWEPVGEGEI